MNFFKKIFDKKKKNSSSGRKQPQDEKKTPSFNEAYLLGETVSPLFPFGLLFETAICLNYAPTSFLLH